jgi:hypothetical protein
MHPVSERKSILMGSDDGVQHSELLSFWTLSIVQYSRNPKKKIREHNVSETGSVSVLRSGGGGTPSLLGPLEIANLNHWTT